MKGLQMSFETLKTTVTISSKLKKWSAIWGKIIEFYKLTGNAGKMSLII